MSEEMMNTKGAAAYLGINEKQVYALIKAGRIPGTRRHGKVGFPEEAHRRVDRNRRTERAQRGQREEPRHGRGAPGIGEQ